MDFATLDAGIAGASQCRPSGAEQPNLRAQPDPSGCPDRRPPSPTCPPETRTAAHGIVEASRAKPTKPRVPVSNQSHGLRYRRSVPKSTTTPDGRCRRSVPTDGNLARTSPRKPRTSTARYRRSVPSETGQTTCASLQPDPKTSVSPERPEIDRGHLSPSWSVRLLAAPRSVGPTVVGSDNTLVPPGVCGTWPLLAVWDPRCRPKQLRPSVNVSCSSAHPSPLHLQTPSTPPKNTKKAFAARLSSNRQRRECRHVRLRFLQSLVELCKLVLKRLLEHR